MAWRDGVGPDDVYRNARRAARSALSHGTVALRTHITVDTEVALSWLEPLLRLRDELRSTLTIQIVALPDTDEVIEGTARPLLREAVDAGADLIGGAPHMVPRFRLVIDELLELAGICGCDLDLHVDESDDPESNSLEYLADRTMTTGFAGNVTAAHCCALSALDNRSAQRVIEKVAAASINVITLPSCNLYLGGRDDRGLVRRGLTRVRELQAAGVNVAFASDNIRDAFNPFGTGDMLQQLLIAAHALHLGTAAELETGLEMGTYNGAQIMGLEDYGLQQGNPASFVVLDDSDLGSAIARVAPRRYVFSDGELVAQTKVERDLAYD
jgi:cytosine deaminase